jgi:hypothetical protein
MERVKIDFAQGGLVLWLETLADNRVALDDHRAGKVPLARATAVR